MNVLTSKKTYAALAAMQAGDAVACALQVAPIKKALDDVGLFGAMTVTGPPVTG